MSRIPVYKFLQPITQFLSHSEPWLSDFPYIWATQEPDPPVAPQSPGTGNTGM